jgi:hypothetical protein
VPSFSFPAFQYAACHQGERKFRQVKSGGGKEEDIGEILYRALVEVSKERLSHQWGHGLEGAQEGEHLSHFIGADELGDLGRDSTIL